MQLHVLVVRGGDDVLARLLAALLVAADKVQRGAATRQVLCSLVAYALVRASHHRDAAAQVNL